jgi:hypothetical protein
MKKVRTINKGLKGTTRGLKFAILLFLTCILISSTTQSISEESLKDFTMDSTLHSRSCANKFARRLDKLYSALAGSDLISSTVLTVTDSKAACSDEFKLYGSCCNQEKLNAYISLKVKRWGESIKGFLEQMEKNESLFVGKGGEIAAKMD